MSILFPLTDVLDDRVCYRWFESILWSQGRVCARCGARDRLNIHNREREPVLDYQCQHCRHVFNLFTGTLLQGTHRRPAQLYIIVRGIAQGVSTNQLHRELDCPYKGLLVLRHKIQHWVVQQALAAGRLEGQVAEMDELYQNAGEKRGPARRSGRSAPQARQQTTRPRLMGDRPRAGGRRGQSPDGPGALASLSPREPSTVGRGRRGHHRAGGGGQHR